MAQSRAESPEVKCHYPSTTLRRRTIVLRNWRDSPSTVTLAPFRVFGISDGHKYIPKPHEIVPPYYKKYFIEKRNTLLTVISDYGLYTEELNKSRNPQPDENVTNLEKLSGPTQFEPENNNRKHTPLKTLPMQNKTCAPKNNQSSAEKVLKMFEENSNPRKDELDTLTVHNKYSNNIKNPKAKQVRGPAPKVKTIQKQKLPLLSQPIKHNVKTLLEQNNNNVKTFANVQPRGLNQQYKQSVMPLKDQNIVENDYLKKTQIQIPNQPPRGYFYQNKPNVNKDSIEKKQAQGKGKILHTQTIDQNIMKNDYLKKSQEQGTEQIQQTREHFYQIKPNEKHLEQNNVKNDCIKKRENQIQAMSRNIKKIPNMQQNVKSLMDQSSLQNDYFNES
ncbi:putative autophagy-related protein 11 [Drosophila virilis]|uniref:Uncharacterized protein n=1 Tax=Drosophila virilis TaxID=7244 RepID=A0A0Q9WC05_DROVI|nr:uncharacterized protein LOC26530989 [Drosophila virilis]KRF82205.1 uncharacterized protein Dvir_GJ26219 [Drosophila virilis]